jgi:citrate synthase
MAALAVGAGHLSGGHEIFLAMEAWKACGIDLDLWRNQLTKPHDDIVSIWPEPEHPSGFDPHAISTTTIVRQTLQCLASLSPGPRLNWLEINRKQLEEIAEHPLAISGVAAAAFADLDFTAEEAEMLHLLLRLPGAAAHALEQWNYGHKNFPFFAIDIENDPGRGQK